MFNNPWVMLLLGALFGRFLWPMIEARVRA